MDREIHRIPIEKVFTGLNRQRQEKGPAGSLDELMNSIKRVGQLNPIIVKRDLTLVAGERRLMAFRYLARNDSTNLRWKLIDARFVDDLSPAELKLIELEENAKRVDLDWKDHAKAVLDYFTLMTTDRPDYSMEDLSGDLGVARRTCERYMAVGRALESKDSQVAAATSLVSAYAVVTRQMNRAVDTEMRDFVERAMDAEHEPPTPAAATAPAAAPAPAAFKKRKAAQPKSVICQDFIRAAQEYNGPKFNFLHCDFPYGVNLHNSEQVGVGKWEEYEDTPETYWRLVEALIANHEHLLTDNAHILFWFSMTQYEATRNLFLGSGFSVNPFPIIWHKSDNTGIVPDPKRRPRQVYETALLMSKGDRFLVSPRVNCYSMPSGRRSRQHVSAKPTEMLKEIFAMLVDGSTRMLDPTCGSGTALSAAILHGAAYVEGWDISAENTKIAAELVHETRLTLLSRGAASAPPDGADPSAADLASLESELLS